MITFAIEQMLVHFYAERMLFLRLCLGEALKPIQGKQYWFNYFKLCNTFCLSGSSPACRNSKERMALRKKFNILMGVWKKKYGPEMAS